MDHAQWKKTGLEFLSSCGGMTQQNRWGCCTRHTTKALSVWCIFVAQAQALKSCSTGCFLLLIKTLH